MMTTLLASAPKRRMSPAGLTASILLHGAIIAAAVTATAVGVKQSRDKIVAEKVVFVAPPPPKTAEPPKVAPPPKAKAPTAAPKVQAPRPTPPVPQIVAPRVTPVTIAPPDLKAPPAIPDEIVAKSAPAEPIGTGRGVANVGNDGLRSGPDEGSAYSENQVDRAVEVTRASPPRYPDALRSMGVTGNVVMRFIVGADGKVEPGSIEVIDSPNEQFTDAVKRSLLNTRYRAAEAGGRAVRQLVEQSFTFKLDR